MITVAEINDNASYIYDSYYDPESKGVYFCVDIKVPGKYSFQVDKTPGRVASEIAGIHVNKYNYPKGLLELRRIDGDYIIYQGLLSSRRTLFRSYTLQPGKHVAFVKIDYTPKFEKDFEVNLAIYSDYACEIDIATTDEVKAYERKDQVDWCPSEKCELTGSAE